VRFPNVVDTKLPELRGRRNTYHVMITTTAGRAPNYFLVVCGGNVSLPPVEGGVWGGRRVKGFISGSGVLAGDVLLLYQNLGFRGIGIVTRPETGGEEEFIDYQYLPLCHPVRWNSLDDLRKTIPELRTPLVFKGNFLQKISTTSFRAAIAGRQIDWP
jgi:hypothetical protein